MRIGDVLQMNLEVLAKVIHAIKGPAAASVRTDMRLFISVNAANMSLQMFPTEKGLATTLDLTLVGPSRVGGSGSSFSPHLLE